MPQLAGAEAGLELEHRLFPAGRCRIPSQTCPLSLPGAGGVREEPGSQQSIVSRGSWMAPVKISHVVSFSSQVSGAFPRGGSKAQVSLLSCCAVWRGGGVSRYGV